MLGALLMIALLLRLGGAFWRPPAEALALNGDQRRYDEIGWHVASGRGFAQVREGKLVPTAFVVGPLYPLFLALVYKIVGHRPDIIRGLQCVIGVLFCWVLYRLGRLLFDQRIGLLVAGCAAVYPVLIRHLYFGGPAFLVTENLFAPLLAVSVLAIVRMARRPTVMNQVAAGVCLGLSALMRSSMILFPVALFGWLLLLRQWPWRRVVGLTVAVTLGMVLTIAPWTWRNYRVFGQFIPLSTQGGLGFWYSNNPQASGGWIGAPLPTALAGEHPDELTTNRAGFQAGWQALRADPGRLPLLLVKKVLVFWLIFHDTTTWEVNWTFLLLGLLALFGWWGVRHRPAAWLPVIVPCGYFTAISMLFYGDPRFRAPLEPLLILLAAVGMMMVIRQGIQHQPAEALA